MLLSKDYTWIRAKQSNSLHDSCKLQTASKSVDSFGQELITYTDGSEIKCGLEMKPGNEVHGRDKTTVIYDAILRLAHGTAIGEQNKVKITKRNGETLTVPLIFEIVSPPQTGISGIRVLLKRFEL